ncbi:CAP domain-containing protein [Knoellia sp. 3-2P3]|uniref:CAP domain-containing protein n=1 Tax=unclassified Knoellia TaxID=2618719 RepID=UPI0023DAB22B|nr:CAP domain-containing protein [Knoellia sp. 3-2P3]MDF2092981.1 CAP domain-containing protein [Knoellia sp. 3-2P3]
MARHSAHPGAGKRRLVGAAAVAALLVGSGSAVLAFGRDDTAPSAHPSPATSPTEATAAPTTTPTTATPTTTKAKPKASPEPKATPARTTTAPARAASRTTAPKPVQAAPKPSPRTTTPRTTSAPKPSPKPVATSSGVAAQVLALVNDERARAGCGAVSSSSALQRAAQGHSADMAANDYFSHTSQDGRSFSDRIRATGYGGGAIAENIAAGQSTAGAVMKSWMNSPGHRANILNCSYRHLGVGYAKGGSYGHYWTQDFGG